MLICSSRSFLDYSDGQYTVTGRKPWETDREDQDAFLTREDYFLRQEYLLRRLEPVNKKKLLEVPAVEWIQFSSMEYLLEQIKNSEAVQVDHSTELLELLGGDEAVQDDISVEFPVDYGVSSDDESMIDVEEITEDANSDFQQRYTDVIFAPEEGGPDGNGFLIQ